MTDSQSPALPGTPSDVPTSARAYGWLLGGKDNYEVDRQFIRTQLEHFPAGLDITRQNRLFLYRAVRYLTLEAGIRQFVDMGCGLPTDSNVHQVAQGIAPGARVVYVDIDPVVLAHGRALLSDNATTAVITADMRDQERSWRTRTCGGSSTSTSRSPCCSCRSATTCPTRSSRAAC
nr:hypothetical protein GCM10010200_002750 [Actinomadura rugatobispora]